MNQFRPTLIALFTISLAVPGFSQDVETSAGKNDNASKSEGLRKMTNSQRNWNFDIRIDEQALEANIENAIENSMRSIEVALDRIEIHIAPIEIDLGDLNLNLDPIVVNIPDLDIDIEPIEIDLGDLDIDLDHGDYNWDDDDDSDDGDDEEDDDWSKHQDKHKEKDKHKSEKHDQKEKNKAKGLKKIN